jgi:hypothetical protein
MTGISHNQALGIHVEMLQVFEATHNHAPLSVNAHHSTVD